MADVISEVDPPSGSVTPATPMSTTGGQIPLEQPPQKLKGRRRLLQNLQRISSSPNIPRRGRSASTGYRRDGLGSLSCVSLSSSAYGPCFPNGSSSQLYSGLNIPPTPPSDAESSLQLGHASPRIRLVRQDTATSTHLRSVPLPSDIQPGSRGPRLEDEAAEAETVPAKPVPTRAHFNFWEDMPAEIKTQIFRYLSPKEIIRCSAVSRSWNRMCYDGQLWSNVDTTDYYRDIPSDVLVKIITCGGPFVRDLNLRGCVQLKDKWPSEGDRITTACQNVVNFSLEGCRIDKSSLHYFLLRNPRLEYINVSGLPAVTNPAMKIIAQSCPNLEALNVSWCANVDSKGLKKIVQSCLRLKDLRAGEVRGFADEELMLQLFKRNTLERLIIARTDVTDQSLKVLMHGKDPEIDVLTDLPVVPPRKFKHLDLHQCTELTDAGVRSLAHNVPALEGLQLSQCPQLSDDSIIDVIRTTPLLTHLELEDLERITNSVLTELASAPCAERLEHLNISYCENLGDVGMLQVFKTCQNIRSVEMDNTRVSDLSLMEAGWNVRKRGYGDALPRVGLKLVVFDCSNVTWAGVKEILSSNAFVPRSCRSSKPSSTVVTVTKTGDPDSLLPATTTTVITTSSHADKAQPLYPSEIIQLKCFFGWQMTVEEHTKRVLRGDLAAANRLDRKWSDYMMATEEAGVTGAGARRRRRRAREAERLYNADEDDADGSRDSPVSALGGRRRRAHSGGCVVM